MLELVVVYFVGAIMGVILGKTLSRSKTVGCLRIDRSDEEGPYLFLELDQPLQTFYNEKRVSFEIKNEDFLPRN